MKKAAVNGPAKNVSVTTALPAAAHYSGEPRAAELAINRWLKSVVGSAAEFLIYGTAVKLEQGS